jgi:hypothetical protein
MPGSRTVPVITRIHKQKRDGEGVRLQVAATEEQKPTEEELAARDAFASGNELALIWV